jgi:hypothetical protein
MAAAAHNAKFAKEAGISQKVAREFHRADQKRNAITRALVSRR